MFEGSGAALGGMVQGLHGKAVNQVEYLAAEGVRLKDKTVAMAREIERLRAALAESEALRQAEGEALDAVTAAWRTEHPVSHMHDVVGTLGSGRVKRRNLEIWVTAFDAAARKLGIRSPEAHRIS